MLPRAIATDLDGTLLRSDGTLDQRSCDTLAAIQRAGVLLVLCTARPPRWMRPLAEATGHGGVAVCANGAVVWDLHADAALETRALAPDVAADVVRRLKTALPEASWAIETADGFGREPGYVPHWPVPDGTVVDDVEALVTRPVTKLLMRHEHLMADALVAVARDQIGDLAEPTHSNSEGSLLEITAAGVSKASALARLCAQRDIDRSQVIAFGDMPNDLPMLEWAGHAVAVANAHPDVLAVADEITLGNDDAGVAHVLERMLSGGTASAA